MPAAYELRDGGSHFCSLLNLQLPESYLTDRRYSEILAEPMNIHRIILLMQHSMAKSYYSYTYASD